MPFHNNVPYICHMICIKHISRSYIDCSFHLAIRGSYDEFELTSTRPNPRRLISFKGDMRVSPFLYIFLRNSSLFLLSKIFVWASSSLSRSSVILQTLWNIQPIFTTKNCLSLWWFRVQLWSSQRIRHMGHTDVKVESKLTSWKTLLRLSTSSKWSKSSAAPPNTKQPKLQVRQNL